jgi:hypothetical protein
MANNLIIHAAKYELATLVDKAQVTHIHNLKAHFSGTFN